jgi:hypothetical protein
VKHHAEVAHHVPGRLRIKIPTACGNIALLQSLKLVFAGMPGIDSVTVKPNSGSLVLHYDPRLEAEMDARFANYNNGPVEMMRGRPGDEFAALAQKVEAEAEFLAGHSEWARAVVNAFKDFDRQIRILSNNTIDLKIALALGLAIATFFGVGAQAATPMWVTLVLFAANHFMEQHAAAAPAAAAR